MSEEPPLVSVVIPVRDGERFLREAIDSILAQTHRPLEVIVVDDGSTDGTPQVAQSFGGPVRYVRQEPAGPPAARNRGVDEARGAFIAFLDADDLWEPEKLARQLEAFAAEPALDLCVTHGQNFWEAELAEEEAGFRDHPRSEALPVLTTQSLLARREAFERAGRFDPDLRHGDSTEWFMRAEATGLTRRLLSEVLVRRRLHKDSLSRREAADSRREFLRLVKASLDRRRAAGAGEQE